MANDVVDSIVAGTPIFPDIAVNSDGTNHDITDPTSSQPNTSYPAGPIVASGWPGNGIPIFSNFNKLFRLITQWIRWLYTRVMDLYYEIGNLTSQVNAYFHHPLDVAFAAIGTEGGTATISLRRVDKTITLYWITNITTAAGLYPTGVNEWVSSGTIPADFLDSTNKTYNLGLCRVYVTGVGSAYQFGSAVLTTDVSTHKYHIKFFADPDYTTDFIAGQTVSVNPGQFTFTLLDV